MDVKPQEIPLPSATDVSRRTEKIGAVAPYVLVCAALALTLLVWKVTANEIMAEAEKNFQFQILEMKSSIRERMQTYELAIRGAAALSYTIGDMTRKQWKTYVDNLDLAVSYPGLQGLGLAVVVPENRLAEHQRKIRAEGFPDFTVKPAGPRPVYTSVIYIEPFDLRNKRAFGYDMFSEPVRRTAMERSRDTGKTTISGKVRLVQEMDEDIQAGFLMYVPVYDRTKGAATVAARRESLLGYVYSPFRMQDFMHGIFGHRPADMHIEIYDGDGINKEHLMFASDASPGASERAHKSLFNVIDKFEAYGATWTLSFRSLSSFEKKIRQTTPYLVLFSGIIISLLLFFVMFSINSTRKKATRLAAAMASAFRESEEKLRLLLESTGEGIYGIDLVGQCTFCNPACLKILGFARQEALLGKNMHHLIHHSHADGAPYPVAECTIYKTFRQGVGMHFDDEVFWRADGTSFPVECWANPIIKNGRVIGAVIGFVDITEKKRNRERLLNLNERFELAVTSAHIGIWDWEIGRDLVVWDARMEALYGLAASKAPRTSQAWLRLVHPEDRERLKQEHQMALAGEKDLDTAFRVVRPDGRLCHLKAYARVLRSDTGRPLRMTGVNLDITERMLAERSLRESEEKFRAMSDASNDALIMIDAGDIVHFWNKAAETMFGYTRDEVLGRKLHFMITRLEDQDKAYPGLELFTRTGAGPVIGNVREFMAIRRDGTLFPVERSVASFSMAGRWYAVGTVRDVTERHEMERLKKEFISTVSHELRTPLTSIRGSLGLVLGAMAAQLPEQVRQLLRIAADNTTRLIAMINDLLDIEKIESGRMEFHLEAVDLVKIVGTALEENRHYAVDSGVTFRLQGNPPTCPVLADPSRLTQVMANLLSNAAKFSPRDGTVEVAVEQRDSRARVSVRDHGPGVPEKFRSRIFQKFAQGDSSDTRKRGGTGLGLAIARQIVHTLGGTIGYQPAEGGGTIFFFELPLKATECDANDA